MGRWAVTLGLLLLSGGCSTVKIGPTLEGEAMPRFGKGYEHIDDAAAAALLLLERQPRVATQEYMGLLVQDPDTRLYYRTDFHTQGQRDSSEWRGHPEGKPAGIVHSHPAPRNGSRYPTTHLSVQDMNTAHEMKVPSYIAAVEEAKGGRRAPAQHRRHVPTSRRLSVPTEGEQFLAQFPIEEYLQYIARERRAKNPIAAAIIDEHNRLRVASNGNSATR